MVKMKVKETFFDRVEDRYIHPEKEPVIEREEERAEQLLGAGVVEVWEPDSDKEPEEPTEAPVAEEVEPTEEEVKPKKKAKKAE